MATRNWAVAADSVGAYNGSNEYGGDCDHLPVGYMSWLGGPSRAFLKFTLDWSGVTQITKAELHIRTGSGYHGSIGGSGTHYVDLVTSYWAEAAHPGETWFLNDQPDFTESVDTGYRASLTARSTNTWYTVDITAIANRWAPSYVKQSNGSPGPGVSNYGIRIISNSEYNSAYRTEFLARETAYDAYVTLTYSTNQAPVVSSLDSPPNGGTITDDTPSLVFTCTDPDAGDTIAQYAIQVDDSSGFGSPAIDLSDQSVGTPANPKQVTHVCSTLTRGKTWYWRAQAEDNQGLKGSWSGYRSFYLATQPTVDSLSPTSNGFAYIHNLGDTAVWTDGSFAKPRLSFRYLSSDGLQSANYRVRIYDASSGGSTVYDSGTVAWVASSGTTKVLDVGTAMPRNTSRWWTVVVTDSAGGSSGESARQQFRVQWGQALYEANPGAGSSSWAFDLGAVAGGQVTTIHRTATGAGGTGTTSSWKANIADLTPAAYLNTCVRLGPTTAGTNVTLGDMEFTYLGSSVTPDNWVCVPSNEWVLSTAERRFGAKSLKCSKAATASNRYCYPYRETSGDDIPVVPGVTYTWSAYVKTPVALTGGYLRLAVYATGSLSTQVPTEYVLKATDTTTDTTDQSDGWERLTMTYTAPPGWTKVRPMIHYQQGGAVAEDWYVDGSKHEEGPVATPWQAGAIGAVILDSGGIAVDGASGGSFRLRGVDGSGVVELGPEGLLFGLSSEVHSPTSGELRIGQPDIAAQTLAVSGGSAAGTPGARLNLDGSGGNRDYYIRNENTILYVGESILGDIAAWDSTGGSNPGSLVDTNGAQFIFGGYLDLARDSATGRSFVRGWVGTESNPRVDLRMDSGGQPSLAFGPGGGSAVDVAIVRPEANAIALTSTARFDHQAVGRHVRKGSGGSPSSQAIGSSSWARITSWTNTPWAGLGTNWNQSPGTDCIRLEVPGWYQIDVLVYWASSTAVAYHGLGIIYADDANPSNTVVQEDEVFAWKAASDAVGHPMRATYYKWFSPTTYSYVGLMAYNGYASSSWAVAYAELVVHRISAFA